MTVLLTGADGFIGSHLTEKLVSLGYEVRAFVLYNSFNSWGWFPPRKTEFHKFLLYMENHQKIKTFFKRNFRPPKI